MGGKTYTFWWALASAVIAAIGGLGPWVTFLGFSVSGTEGDGWVVIAAAAAAAGLVLWHNADPALWRLAVAGLAALVAFAVAVDDWSQIESIASEDEDEFSALLADAVSPGWGLILSTLASVSLAASLLVHYLKFAGGRFELGSPSGAEPERAQANAEGR
jgi:hypothetical protein